MKAQTSLLIKILLFLLLANEMNFLNLKSIRKPILNKGNQKAEENKQTENFWELKIEPIPKKDVSIKEETDDELKELLLNLKSKHSEEKETKTNIYSESKKGKWQLVGWKNRKEQ